MSHSPVAQHTLEHTEIQIRTPFFPFVSGDKIKIIFCVCMLCYQLHNRVGIYTLKLLSSVIYTNPCILCFKEDS
jgi:hypothetical protein